jgi:hypothetical protein
MVVQRETLIGDLGVHGAEMMEDEIDNYSLEDEISYVLFS